MFFFQCFNVTKKYACNEIISAIYLIIMEIADIVKHLVYVRNIFLVMIMLIMVNTSYVNIQQTMTSIIVTE